MATKFKNGDAVKQVIPAPIEGKVASFRFDENAGEISYIVEWTDAEGVVHQRSFTDDQIEAV